jgi:putative toxin-antitoxin system antitoxin component (TIGR02293 family)
MSHASRPPMAVIFEEVAGLLGLRGHDRPASPLEIIGRIQEGLPVKALDRVCLVLAPDDANFKYQVVPRATLARRKSRHERLSVDESERVARLARVWAFAHDVWGSAEEARSFFFRPHVMLEGRRPIDVVLATDMGSRLVEDILGRLKYGSAA